MLHTPRRRWPLILLVLLSVVLLGFTCIGGGNTPSKAPGPPPTSTPRPNSLGVPNSTATPWLVSCS